VVLLQRQPLLLLAWQQAQAESLGPQVPQLLLVLLLLHLTATASKQQQRQ
jgi:hypothetical protein